MELMIKTGRDEKRPIREVPVPDLWHLARAVAKTADALAEARAVDLLSADQAEDVLTKLLEEAAVVGDDGV